MIRTTMLGSLVFWIISCAGPAAESTGRQKMGVEQGVESKGQQSELKLSAEAMEFRKSCMADVDSVKKSMHELESLKGEKTVESVLVPLDDISRLLDRAGSKASLYRNVHPDPSVRQVAELCEQEVSKVGTDLGLSRPIYDALEKVDLAGTDELTRRYAKHWLRDFRRAGVDKDEATREKIKALEEQLVRINQSFSRNIRSDVRFIEMDSAKDLDGLPEDFIASHKPGENGKIRVTTDYPDYIPFMTYAKSDSKRLELYKEFRNRGWPANDEVLKEMIEKRTELANFLGYKTWADYATEDKMIKNSQAAQSFIDRISDLVKQRSQEDADELLQRLKKDDPSAKEVGDWQKSYLGELVKRDSYSFDSQKLRQYFPYETVKKGVLGLTSKMFGVTYKKVDAKVWAPSVDAYELWEGDKLRGRFYLDMHPRKDKYKHAAAFPIQVGLKDRQLPEAALVCNFPGGDDGSDLMDHHQVVTFFHEFGHLLHHLFGGRQKWVGQSGIATEWDFVEAPSQLLEEWAWDPEVLKSFAKNDKGEVIPDELIEKMRRARDFGKGLFIRQQMYYAALSLAYYNRGSSMDTTELAKQLAEKYAPFKWVDGTHFQASFGHLSGYSSNYYTYMWSLVIAKDLFAFIKAKGLLDPKVLTSYRKAILDAGGSKDAADLVKDFLGRDFSFDAFSHWVNKG